MDVVDAAAEVSTMPCERLRSRAHRLPVISKSATLRRKSVSRSRGPRKGEFGGARLTQQR